MPLSYLHMIGGIGILVESQIQPSVFLYSRRYTKAEAGEVVLCAQLWVLFSANTMISNRIHRSPGEEPFQL